jgi:hypothetical protein
LTAPLSLTIRLKGLSWAIRTLASSCISVVFPAHKNPSTRIASEGVFFMISCV